MWYPYNYNSFVQAFKYIRYILKMLAFDEQRVSILCVRVFDDIEPLSSGFVLSLEIVSTF